MGFWFFLGERPIAPYKPICSMLLNSIFISNRTVSGNLEAQDRMDFHDLELFKAMLRYFLLL